MRVRSSMAFVLVAGLATVPLVINAGVVAGQPAAPTFAESFEVSGLVASPRCFTRDDLAAMSTWTMPVVFAAGQSVQSGTFSGPPLLDVIQVAGGPVLDTSRNNDRLRKFIMPELRVARAEAAWASIRTSAADGGTKLGR